MKINEGNYFYVENPKYHPELKNKIMVVVGTEKLRKDESRRVKLNHVNDDDNIVLPAVSQFEKYLKPIRLTKDWFIKLGFKFKCEELGALFFEIQIGIDFLVLSDKGHFSFVSGKSHWYMDRNFINTEYVHQAQNLYNSLTDLELATYFINHLKFQNGKDIKN